MLLTIPELRSHQGPAWWRKVKLIAHTRFDVLDDTRPPPLSLQDQALEHHRTSEARQDALKWMGKPDDHQ